MSTPGTSLFQGTDIQISNPKNVEEEEDLEERQKRNEEMHDLIRAKLNDFNFDDCTINSSTNVSMISEKNVEQTYKDAITPHDQLNVLYEVRCRELEALKDQFQQYKLEKSKEIDSQTHQKLLLEGEARQLSISLKNAENLLVDKTETINHLTKDIEQKDLQINKLEKLVNEYEADIVTYKSEISELYLKLQSQNGPFNLNAKFNSEELQRSLQEKINKLEAALSSQLKKLELSDSEKLALQDEIQRLIMDKLALEADNKLIFENMESAQLQCKELVDILQVLKNECDHFKARVNHLEKNTADGDLSKDDGTSADRLRKMLVDKSVEINTLKAKLRTFENNLEELLEYRQLKSDLFKKEFPNCSNQSHSRDLHLMQNELRNYQKLIDDKNQQIANLNLNNRDLKEKIEEMLLQTRNEIQNISSKYNMPQLEHMKAELEKAEYTGQMLARKLEDSEGRRLSLLQKLETQKNDLEFVQNLKQCKEDLEKRLNKEQDRNEKLLRELEEKKEEIMAFSLQVDELKDRLNISESSRESILNGDIKDDYTDLKDQLKNLMKHLESKSRTKEPPELVKEVTLKMDNFLNQIKDKNVEKGVLEEHVTSWKKLLKEFEEKDPDSALKSQYKEAVMNLHASQGKVKELSEKIGELERCFTLQTQELDNSEKLRHSLETEIEQLKSHLRRRDDELAAVKIPFEGNKENINVDLASLMKELQEVNKELKVKEHNLTVALESIRQYEQDKRETKKWLEKTKKEMDRLKSDNFKLEQCQATRANTEVLKNIEFDSRIQEEVIQRELKLRDGLQVEYQKRIEEIEVRYQKSMKETADLCRSQKQELEQQDKKFREYLKVVMSECEACVNKLEREKAELMNQLRSTKSESEELKKSIFTREQNHRLLLQNMKKASQKNYEDWEKYSKKVVSSCLNIEVKNKRVAVRVLDSMKRYDEEIDAIERRSGRQAIKESIKERKK